MTEPEGAIRVYLDAGPLMKHSLFTLLKAPQDNEPSPTSVPISKPYVSRLLAAFKQEEWRSTHGKDTSPSTTHKVPLHPPQSVVERIPIEPLSRQEQRVLRLLVAGQTYAEMAEMLVVSPNTIKTQDQ